MKCQHCNEREARVHLTEMKEGKKTELDLCEECAKSMGLVGALEAAVPEEVQKITCPTCGLTLKGFMTTGRLGCEDCYEAFGEYLEEVLLKTHSASRHKGKIPQRLSGPDRTKRMLEYLKQELDRAIKQEKFEHAASLRDRIAMLEAKDVTSK